MDPHAFNSLYERVWSESEVSTFETRDTEEFLAVELEEMTMENILQILTILKPSTEEMFDQDLLEEYRLIRTSIQKGSLTVPVINLTLKPGNFLVIKEDLSNPEVILDRATLDSRFTF